MKKFSSIILTAMVVASPVFFAGCADREDEGLDYNNSGTMNNNGTGTNNNDEVGRDRNVPNNIEDNYTKDADKE